MKLLNQFKVCRNDSNSLMKSVMTKVNHTGACCPFYTNGSQECRKDGKKCVVRLYKRTDI